MKKFNSGAVKALKEASKITPEAYGLNPELAKSCFEEVGDEA